MTKNLDTADTIVKLTLSTTLLILYYAGEITGKMAYILMLLAVSVLFLYALRLIIKGVTKD